MISLTISKTKLPNATTRVCLPHDKRVKARVRVTLEDGRDAGIFLERGEVLSGGDTLVSEDGVVVEVMEEKETVSVVQIDDALQLAKACYHLGNRHVGLQISDNQLCYLHDHVLDDMLRKQGYTVKTCMMPFTPESGSYGHSHHGDDHHEHTHHHAD
ncbi:MAG: urease accessory protein UreE [Granulosicoccus sp.]|nr:urease accessory protein UreE [Granulosicoccus sp.]